MGLKKKSQISINDAKKAVDDADGKTLGEKKVIAGAAIEMLEGLISAFEYYQIMNNYDSVKQGCMLIEKDIKDAIEYIKVKVPPPYPSRCLCCYC